MGRPRKNASQESSPEESLESKERNDEKIIDDLLKSLEKEHGAGVAMRMDDSVSDLLRIDRWEVDSPNISYVLGGGLPKGRIIELYGPESSGKTSLACYLAGQVQKGGGRVFFIDAEHAIDPEYAKSFGWDITKSVLSQPDYGEQALDVAEKVASSKVYDLIIVDSVAALTPLAEVNGSMEDQQMGLMARMLGKGLRKLAPICGNNKVTIIFINQIRMKIGFVLGNPECVTPDTIIDII